MNADREPACSLIAAAVAEGKSAYGGSERDETPSATAIEMGPPVGAFLVAYELGLPVACGGLKRLDGQTAEIKRMYVLPEARGRGLGRSLLTALEEEARRLGYRSVRLDTGLASPTLAPSTSLRATRRSPPTTATRLPTTGGEKRL